MIIMPLAAALLATTLVAQDAKFKINDYSTDFGKAAMASIKDAPDAQVRADDLKPVVTGYFYWRMQTLGKVPSSKFEKLHMNVCAAMLDFYYPGVAKEWEPLYKRIENESALELPEDVQKWLSNDLRKRVFDPYFNIDSTKPPTATDKQIGEFFIGATLGDLSGNMVLQYMSNGLEIPREWMAENLETLETNLKDYPKAFTPAIRTKLSEMVKLRKEKIIEPADFPALEKAHKAALDAIAAGS